jgi:SAM-dependent methyltransferase
MPWDIGGPQPVIQQLVAYGALRGEVLDPGTGPGHHAIFYASQGYSTTGIDGSPTAIERAKRNADRAGVEVNFQVGDATKLDGFEDRFDTVVDSMFYHLFIDDEETQTRYARALHRATKHSARLFMFEFGGHNVNGVKIEGWPADNFERVFGACGWHVDYVGASTYVEIWSPETLVFMKKLLPSPQAEAAMFKPLRDQLQVITPLLENNRVHMPVWAVAASRID